MKNWVEVIPNINAFLIAHINIIIINIYNNSVFLLELLICCPIPVCNIFLKACCVCCFPLFILFACVVVSLASWLEKKKISFLAVTKKMSR